MNLYHFLVQHSGRRAANLIVVIARGVLITLIVLFSDKGFSTFSYLGL